MTDKPRSSPQHRRFFGLIQALYEHWPESMDFQPDNEEHLRAYLLVKAKHRQIKTFVVDNGDEIARLIPIVTAIMLNRYSWAWTTNEGVNVCVPASMAFDKMPHATACAVFDAVEAYVRTLGIDPDKLLKEHEASA